MKKIRTEIRHDRIENDNRKNDLQSKAKSGLKTAKADPEGKQETQKTAASGEIQTQLKQKAAEKSYENKQEAQKATANGEIHTQVMHDDTGYDRVESDNGINEPQGDAEDWLKADEINSESKPKAVSDGGIQTQIRHDDMESGLKTAVTKQETPKFKSSSGIQTQIKRNSIESSVKRDVIQNKAERGIQTQIERSDTDRIDMPKAASSREIQSQIKRNSIEKNIKRDVIQNKAEGGIKTQKGKVSNAKGNAKAIIAGVFRTAATVGTVTANVMQSTIPNSGDDMSSEAASKVKETSLNTANKSLETVRKFAEKKAKSAKDSSKWRSNTQSKSNVGKVKQKAAEKVKETPKAIKAVGKTAKTTGKATGKTAKTAGKVAGMAARGVSSAVGAAQKIKGVSSNGDISGDLAEQTKAAAEKGAEMGFNASKKVVKNIKKPVKAAQRTLQKVQKKAIKKTVKTTAKVSQKTAKTAAQVSAKAAKTTVKTTSKIVAGIAKAIGSLMASPAGWIVLLIVVIVVLLILLFSLLSSTTSTAAGAAGVIVSPLNWIFSNSDSSEIDDLKDTYEEYLSMADDAYKKIVEDISEGINGLGLDDNDILEFNGATISPASSAWYSVKTMLLDANENRDLTYWTYFVEVYYIYRLRTEDDPQLTLDGMYGFMKSYYYEMETSTESGITCPTADCMSTEFTHPSGKYCLGDDYDEETDTPCPGHTVWFCPGNHKKVTITFMPVANITEVLEFTAEEYEMLSLGLELLDELFPEEGEE